MKLHLPASFWEELFVNIETNNLQPDVVRKGLGLNKATFYRKKKEHEAGGVQPRRPGSGRKEVYHPQDYEQMIREILREMPPTVGHKRVWMAMRKKDVPFCQGTCYRILKKLNLLVPQRKGRSRKKFSPVVVEGPGQMWIVDTTTHWVRNSRYEIYVAIDAYSRWVPKIVASKDRRGLSTVDFYAQAFKEDVPVMIHTDNGTEFSNRNALAYLEENGVQWRHGPTHTPQAQGLVERLNRTLKEEWLEWKDPKDLSELQTMLDEFTKWYNTVREHSALEYRVPEEVHHATA